MTRPGFSNGKLYAQIASSLRTMIEEGRLRPGDKLPPLADLATQFECSRATVREAISALRGQGLIEVRHGDGSYVRSASVEMWMEPLDAVILLGEGQAKSLIELMTTVLAGIVSFAALRRYRFDFTVLNRQLFELECADRPSEEAIAAELAFYAHLAAGADNPLLENAFRVLQEALRSSLRVYQAAEGNRRVTMGLELCKSLVGKIQEGDDVAARELVYRYGDKLSTQVGELRHRSHDQ